MVTARDSYDTGRLTARPQSAPPTGDVTPGLQPLQLAGQRDGLLYVPGNYAPVRPAALAVMLHGAGGNAEHGLSLLRQFADERNVILVAPASRLGSWDIITARAFGKDVIFIDQALSLVFGRYAVDPARVAVGGFSDGASYALCLGLTNGDLFTHVIAFSPGFVYTEEERGKPAVFVSHGTRDRVLPIDPCSRRIVPRLQRKGLSVNSHEFDGEHLVPDYIAAAAVDWFEGR